MKISKIKNLVKVLNSITKVNLDKALELTELAVVDKVSIKDIKKDDNNWFKYSITIDVDGDSLTGSWYKVVDTDRYVFIAISGENAFSISCEHADKKLEVVETETDSPRYTCMYTTSELFVSFLIARTVKFFKKLF